MQATSSHFAFWWGKLLCIKSAQYMRRVLKYTRGLGNFLDKQIRTLQFQEESFFFFKFVKSYFIKGVCVCKSATTLTFLHTPLLSFKYLLLPNVLSLQEHGKMNGSYCKKSSAAQGDQGGRWCQGAVKMIMMTNMLMMGSYNENCVFLSNVHNHTLEMGKKKRHMPERYKWTQYRWGSTIFEAVGRNQKLKSFTRSTKMRRCLFQNVVWVKIPSMC